MIRKDRGLRPGDLVMVCNPKAELGTPANKYEGETFVIKSRKLYPTATGPRRAMFTLYGANSDAGMPYWFLPEELIPC